ncbi:MAG: MerR family transcriptional regulator [Microthrixaceae bacterium]
MSDSARSEHLSIGEVLSLVQEDFPDVTISKIRFLESQGLIAPERTGSGFRKFYDSDIERLRWILRQQGDHFLPLKVIKKMLEDGADPSAGVQTQPTLWSSADPAAGQGQRGASGAGDSGADNAGAGSGAGSGRADSSTHDPDPYGEQSGRDARYRSPAHPAVASSQHARPGSEGASATTPVGSGGSDTDSGDASTGARSSSAGSASAGTSGSGQSGSAADSAGSGSSGSGQSGSAGSRQASGPSGPDSGQLAGHGSGSGGTSTSGAPASSELGSPVSDRTAASSGALPGADEIRTEAGGSRTSTPGGSPVQRGDAGSSSDRDSRQDSGANQGRSDLDPSPSESGRPQSAQSRSAQSRSAQSRSGESADSSKSHQSQADRTRTDRSSGAGNVENGQAGGSTSGGHSTGGRQSESEKQHRTLSTPADVVAALQEDPRPPKRRGGDGRPESDSTPAEMTPEVGPETDESMNATAADDAGQIRTPLTRSELCELCGVQGTLLDALEQFGFISPTSLGGAHVYDEDAIAVTRLAARYAELGIEPRHLRMYKISAEREAGMIEQLVVPLLKQRNPTARQNASARSEELTAMGAELHAMFLSHQMRRILGT